MSIQKVVVMGAGHGGFQLAATLRQTGYQGSIQLLSDEPGLPYQRPPLSKSYMQGKISEMAMLFRPAAFYETEKVELIHDSAKIINCDAKTVELNSGKILPYDHLIIASGARNRLLNLPGSDLQGVHGIKTRQDADVLIPLLPIIKKLAVIGAGFIGLEFAAVAAAQGAEVHVIELGERPMQRAISEQMSEVFRLAHEQWGVQFHFNTGVSAIEGDGDKVSRLLTNDGSSIEVDRIIYGIGVIPNVEIAADAGLTIENGIVVDEMLLTSDPNISSLGDVANFPCKYFNGKRIRLESVQNAVDQARTIAARLMGNPAPYIQLPWFWTDQGNLKLQIAGLSIGYNETVIVGSVADQKLSVLCFCDGELICVESCNRAGDHMVGRKLLARVSGLTPEIAKVEGFDLKAWEVLNRPEV
ncbi:MAG: pyridine nucleotide-disulfide oxidoreductase [Colwellia sp.]|nr:MAG: pyridine nucleotide-disulfide oxidoreductase [Colwellia sp.]